MPRERRRVLFSGRVQGVGFRYTCQTLARGFEVAGYVRNLSDGRVEVVVEGEPLELDEFVSAIQLDMSSYIREIHAAPEPVVSDPLSGFSVRF
jgi:acylphosphatase